MRRFLAIVILALLVAAPMTGAQGRRFYDDDPIAREPETQDASGVAEWDIELLTDLAINLFATPRDPFENIRARNVNTIDEVPDSNWFTNRIGSRPLSVDEVMRGPISSAGPAAGRWTVVAPKRAGAAPGFTMRDGAGELWFVSFDAKGYPEAATGAIMVANKIFWALGYWQVENHLVAVSRDNLDIASSASVKPMSGRERPMQSSDLDEIFVRSHRSPEGSFRAVAARALPGRIVGGFRYQGTRPDDPNDIVPHQHRRELRALKVFGAWTNLVDMKAGNTLDTVITENGRQVVRHYLQDVGSTFGTGAAGPRDYDEGWEYLLELDRVRTRFFRMGLPLEPWHTARYERNTAIGRFEGEAFDPAAWKPRVPSAALRQARADDGFWAARRVAAFSDDLISAMVKAAQYSNPGDERLLADVLIQRRDKIARHYLNAINPLVAFALSPDGRLTFRNAAVDVGAATAPAAGYRATWSHFNNTDGGTTLLGSPTTGGPDGITPPSGLPATAGAYVRIAIAAVGHANAAWAEPVEVYFTRTGSSWRLVGVERLR